MTRAVVELASQDKDRELTGKISNLQGKIKSSEEASARPVLVLELLCES